MYLHGASELADTNSASKMTCRHKTRGIRWMPLVLAGGGKVLPSICACRKCVGSHSPPEDLQARLQGVGRVNLRQRRISGGVPFKVSCAVEIENREDLWYNKISINRDLEVMHLCLK